LQKFLIGDGDAGLRLDHFLAKAMAGQSRARVQQAIEQGLARVDGAVRKASYRLRAGECVTASAVEPPPLAAYPEDIPLAILYEDAGVVAVDKPAGMVVHAGAGRHAGTLVNALLARYGALSGEGGALRPGIVHRIDKGTSGVLLVAKTDEAHRALARQFAGRTVEKTYLALVEGRMAAEEGRVERPIARDPLHRTRMTARLETGRPALTFWRVRRRFARFTLLEVRIATGRTHQIRVHLASLRHPVAGDALYGAAAHPLGRPFLHAHRVAFVSPATGENVIVVSPLPAELEAWLAGLP
jgi:23S rRNA pseudouridine1911/1915/1917 synthase